MDFELNPAFNAMDIYYRNRFRISSENNFYFNNTLLANFKANAY